ncbi:hypothetical protein [Vibrio owensii]|uniref:hypothetical protein n=1 Tax=Vibrio owensii TaxID=696485 RepID=UPI003CC67A10
MRITPVSAIPQMSFNNHKGKNDEKNSSWDAVFEEISKEKGIVRNNPSSETESEEFRLSDNGMGTLESFLRQRASLSTVTVSPSSDLKARYLQKAQAKAEHSIDFTV